MEQASLVVGEINPLTPFTFGDTIVSISDFDLLVEFQSIDQVCGPTRIGSNPNFVAIFHARKVDLFSRIVFPVGKGSIVAGPGESADLLTGTEISPGGSTVFGLPSRNQR
jgi:hypothetical protein